jgi:hypothetical protein
MKNTSLSIHSRRQKCRIGIPPRFNMMDISVWCMLQCLPTKQKKRILRSAPDRRCASVQPPPLNSIKLNRARPSLYLNPYILHTNISYFSTSVPYERYLCHIRADADHRRRRPSARSPAVQPCHHRHKTVQHGHRKTVMRVSSGTIKTVRREPQDSLAATDSRVGCLARLSRLSGGLRETVRRDHRR